MLNHRERGHAAGLARAEFDMVLRFKRSNAWLVSRSPPRSRVGNSSISCSHVLFKLNLTPGLLSESLERLGDSGLRLSRGVGAPEAGYPLLPGVGAED